MRILFLSTNRFRIGMAQPMPIGLASVIAGIDQKLHAVEVLDLMFSEDPSADFVAAINSFEPEMVAVSIRNTDNLSYLAPQYFLPEARELIDLCRSSARAKVVIGGAAFTTAPEALFDYLAPDFGIAGEGELAFPQLVDCLESGTDWSGVPGLVWRQEGTLRRNPSAFIEDWSGIPFPRRDLFDLKSYAEIGGFSNIVISQGCPMHCAYCDDPYRLGRRQRMKAVELVVDELEAMSAEAGDMPIFFTAPIFNNPPSNAKAICRGIIERDLDISWTALIHPALLDDELAGLMQRSGCVVVSLACDSCSDRMLKSLAKDITTSQLEAAIALLEKHGIAYLLTILFGGPGEDRETIDETLDFLRNCRPLMVSFTLGIRILPNTALGALAVEQKLIAANDPLMEPKFYISPAVEGWARAYLEEACAEHDNWMFSILEESSEVLAASLPAE